MDLTLHGCAIGTGLDQPSGVPEASLGHCHGLMCLLLLNFRPTQPGTAQARAFPRAIETLLLSYPQGHPAVLCASRFGCIVSHRVFLAVAFSTEPLARDTKADQTLSHAVCSVLRQPEIGRRITRAIRVAPDPDVHIRIGFHDFSNVPQLVARLRSEGGRVRLEQQPVKVKPSRVVN